MLSNFLADISHQQLWLAPETASVSSLEVGSEYEDESEAEESETSGSYSSVCDDHSNCSCSCSCSAASSSCSTSSSEEEEVNVQRRYSRSERVKMAREQQKKGPGHHHHHHNHNHRHHAPQQPIKSILRKPSLSAPDLLRRSSTDSMISVEKKAKAQQNANGELNDSQQKWDAPGGAKNAGWSLLNDDRIATGYARKDSNEVPPLASLGVHTHVLDVNITKSTTRNLPTQTKSLKATVNVTTVSVSIEADPGSLVKKCTSTPNFRRCSTGPTVLRSRNSSERRARRRRGSRSDLSPTPSNSTGDLSPTPSGVFGTKPTFRRCTSDPMSLIPRNDRWNSNAPFGESGHVRLDKGPKSATGEVVQRMQARIPRKSRKSAPNLMNILATERKKKPADTGARARWSATPGQLLNRGPPSDVRPKIPRASCPHLLSLGNSSVVSALGDSSVLGDTSSNVSNGANARWSSNAPFHNPATSATGLMNLIKERQSAKEKFGAFVSGTPNGGTMRKPSSQPTRAGVQRTTSHMVRSSNRAMASAPNLLNIKRNISIPQTGGSANAQWGRASKPTLGRDMAARLGSGLGPSPSTRPGVQRTESRMHTSSGVGASAPNLMHLKMRRTTSVPQTGAHNAQWGSQTQQFGGGLNMNRSASSLLKRPGVQRTDSRMTMSKNSLAGASAPNLMHLKMRRTTSVPQAGAQNAQWGSESSQTQQFGGGLTMNRSPSSLLRRPGVQRTDSRMTTSKNSLAGASAPNLMNLRRATSVPPAAGANARCSSSVQPLQSGGSPTRCPSSLLKRPGVQRTDSRMTTSKNSLMGASAPNLMNLRMRRTTSVPQTGAQNAQWGPMSSQSQQSGGGLNMHRSPSSLLKRPGVQRTDSRMSSGNSNLVGASAPNLRALMSLQQGNASPKSRSTNARWGGQSISESQPLLAGLARVPSLDGRPGVQRTTSRMVRGSKLSNASAPNLLNIRRTATMPQNSTSSNAQWGAASSEVLVLGSGLSRTPSSMLRSGVQRANSRMPRHKNNTVGASAPNLQNLHMRRTASIPQPGAANARWGAPAPAAGGSPFASIFCQSGEISEGLKSTLMRAASHTRTGRMVNASTPNLLNFARPTTGPAAASRNAQWNPTSQSAEQTFARHSLSTTSSAAMSLSGTVGVSAANLMGLGREKVPPMLQPHNPGVSHNLSTTPEAGEATASAESTGSRWDNASVFIHGKPSIERFQPMNTVAGDRPKSPPNASQLLRNHESFRANSMLSRSRIGMSAPNLTSLRRQSSAPETGSANAGWTSKTSPRTNSRQHMMNLPSDDTNATLGPSLRAMLDSSRQMTSAESNTSKRWESGSASGSGGMDQWSTMRRQPKRRNSKVKAKKKKSRHHHHHRHHHHGSKEIRRTDTGSPVQSEEASEEVTALASDTAPLPIRRVGTDESVEHMEESQDMMTDLVKEVSDIISSELESHAATAGDAVTQEAMNLAAMEISRALQEGRNSECAGEQQLAEDESDFDASIPGLGCSETIPEYQSDESADESSLPAHPSYQSDDDTLSQTGHEDGPDANDTTMKAPVRSNSVKSEERGSTDEAHNILNALSPRKRPARKPRRRVSNESETEDLNAYRQHPGEGTASESAHNPQPALRSNKTPLRLPRRIPSVDSSRSQMSRTPIMEDSVAENSSLGMPISHIHKPAGSMPEALPDCSDITIPNMGSSSTYAASALSDISPAASPARLEKLRKLVPDLGGKPGTGLKPYSTQSLSKAGSLGSLKNSFALMNDSSSTSKSSGTSSNLLENLKRISNHSSKSSCSQLDSLKAKYALMNDTSSISKSSSVSGSMLGGLTKMNDSISISKSPSLSNGSMFGVLAKMNDSSSISKSSSMSTSSMIGGLATMKDGSATGSIKTQSSRASSNMFGSFTNDVFTMLATAPKLQPKQDQDPAEGEQIDSTQIPGTTAAFSTTEAEEDAMPKMNALMARAQPQVATGPSIAVHTLLRDGTGV